MRLWNLALVCLLLIVPLSSAQERCGVAKDLVVQAIENLPADNAPNGPVEDGLQLLKQAIQICPTLGDAWYFRSLFEARLKNTRASTFALEQAKLMKSDAMEAGLDPFHLAAPVNSTPANPVTPIREKWALVVGIGAFQNRVGMLAQTRKDAEDFRNLLIDPQYGRFKAANIQLLTDKQATTAAVKAGLNWLARNAAPDDLVVIFLASHGTGRQKDTVGGLNYILTHDSDPSDEDKLYGSALPMVEVSEIVRSRIRALRTAIFLDTCHSGGAAKGTLKEVPPSSQALGKMTAGVGRAIISSSQEDQNSYESEKLENGVFTHFLIQSLKQNGGRIPLAAVFDSLRTKVPAAVKEEFQAVQVPVMVKSNTGADIILGADSSSPRAASLIRIAEQ